MPMNPGFGATIEVAGAVKFRSGAGGGGIPPAIPAGARYFAELFDVQGWTGCTNLTLGSISMEPLASGLRRFDRSGAQGIPITLVTNPSWSGNSPAFGTFFGRRTEVNNVCSGPFTLEFDQLRLSLISGQLSDIVQTISCGWLNPSTGNSVFTGTTLFDNSGVLYTLLPGQHVDIPNQQTLPGGRQSGSQTNSMGGGFCRLWRNPNGV